LGTRERFPIRSHLAAWKGRGRLIRPAQIAALRGRVVARKPKSGSGGLRRPRFRAHGGGRGLVNRLFSGAMGFTRIEVDNLDLPLVEVGRVLRRNLQRIALLDRLHRAFGERTPSGVGWRIQEKGAHCERAVGIEDDLDMRDVDVPPGQARPRRRRPAVEVALRSAKSASETGAAHRALRFRILGPRAKETESRGVARWL
jgi:hypothetical protein